MPSGTLYNKINGSYAAVHKTYVKVNGAWVEQSTITNVFDVDDKYTNANLAAYIVDNNDDPLLDNSGNKLEIC